MRQAFLISWTALLTVTLSTGLQAEDKTVTIGDNQNYTIGAYLAYMAPFNKGALVAGSDYSEAMIMHPRSFPDRTLIKWRWPNAACPKGIYNFNAIDFGNVNFTKVEKPVPSLRVSNIRTLREIHRFSLTGDVSSYDVITDMFLTSKPGDSAAKANEVEVFWHTPPYSVSYFNHATPAGTFTSSGVRWKVAVDRKIKPHDVLVMPVDQRDLPDAAVDIKAILDILVAKGIIAGDIYFNGMALGVEVQARGGSMMIDRFSVEYN